MLIRIFCFFALFSFFSALNAQQLGQPMPPKQDVRAEVAQIDKQIKELQDRLAMLQKQQEFAIKESQKLEFNDYLASRSRIEQSNQLQGQIQVVQQQISDLEQKKAHLQLYSR